jgi:hypothetical protein
MAKTYEDPGPLPEGATPAERRKWAKQQEDFLTEGGSRGHKTSLDQPITKRDRNHTDVAMRQLRRNHEQFMAMRSPVKAALWLALSLPAKDTLHKAEMLDRFIKAQKGELEDGKEFTAPEDLTIVEMANMWAAAALKGDLTALEQIAQRVEGKPGLRSDDVDPDDPKQKQQLHAVTENLVAALTQAALANVSPADKAKAIDVEPTLDSSEKQE